MKRYQHELSGTISPPKNTSPITYHIGKLAQRCSLVHGKTLSAEVIAELFRLDKLLRTAKSNLDNIDSDAFRVFMNSYDVFMRIKHDFARQYDLNEALISNAWMKMWEILNNFGEEVLKKSTRIVSFHVAEMPGSMILAADQYWRQHDATNEFWISSFVAGPNNSVGNDFFDDKYGIFSKYADRVIAGNVKSAAGDIGDMSDRGVVEAHIKHAKGLAEKPNFFTSDLGRGDVGDPSKQEEICMWGHFGAAVTALGCLNEGPSLMVLKMYTNFFPLTFSLLPYLSNFFKEFAIFKPITSRPANSEVYWIGFGFNGIDENELQFLLDKLEKKDDSPIVNDEECGDATIDELLREIKYLTERQISHLMFIKNHIRDDKAKIRTYMEPIMEETKTTYMDRYMVIPVKDPLI